MKKTSGLKSKGKVAKKRSVRETKVRGQESKHDQPKREQQPESRQTEAKPEMKRVPPESAAEPKRTFPLEEPLPHVAHSIPLEMDHQIVKN